MIMTYACTQQFINASPYRDNSSGIQNIVGYKFITYNL